MEQTPDSQTSTASPKVATPTNLETHRVLFHATAGEYFRIWIVNIALTILTLGIYSAWAKVRNRKYLDGNVEIAGARFDYHADPVRILMGRILIGVLFIGYSLGGKVSPYIAAVCGVLFLLLFPWILVRGLIFALTNTSYRGVRFGFVRDYAGAYAAYIKGFFAMILTLGLAGPYAAKTHMDFRLNRIRFGKTTTQFSAPLGEFFKIFYLGYLLIFSGLPFLTVLVFWAVRSRSGGDPAVASVAMVLGVIVMYLGVFLGGAFLRARTLNLSANYSKLGDVEFRSDVKFAKMAWIYFTNILACSCTLGLMIPWAVVRTMKYRLECFQVLAPANAFEKFEAEALAEKASAAADATVDFWDVDLGF